MRINRKIPILSILLLIITLLFLSTIEAKTSSYKNSFDTTTVGSLPTSWIIAATQSSGWFSNKQSKKLANWSVIKDANAASGQNTLSLTKLNHSSGSVFNLVYNRDINFKNGEISVNVRANSGDIDQGGGPIWRVKDADNYYVARFNPLEKNFRVYFVKDGIRSQLQSASNINIKQGEWFNITIKQQGDHIEGWINGKKWIDLNDNTFKNAGAVGLWTKADAKSAFDDFSVKAQ